MSRLERVVHKEAFVRSELALRKRILIVDDNLGVREALSFALEDRYDIQTSGDGAAALSLLPLFQPDLVLLDLKMRGLDGIQTLEGIRRTHPALPVIIMTGWSTKEWAERAADLGVSGYLKKPLDLDRIAHRLTELLQSNGRVPPCPPASVPLPDGSVSPVIRRAFFYLHQNFCRPLTLEKIAAAAGVTPFYLCRLFKREMGHSPMAYLNELRFKRAETLLRSGIRPVSAVASQCGFTSPYHFSRLFKARTGFPPVRFL